MDIKNIYRALRPLKNRIHINNALLIITGGMAAAGIIAFLLSCLSFLLPIAFLFYKIVIIYAACFVLSLAISIFSRPGIFKTIKVADSLGLKERIITAYELRDDTSPIAGIQREDALKAASNADFVSLYPLKFPAVQAGAFLALLALVGILFVIPAGSKEKAAKIEGFRKELAAQAEKLAKEKEELAEKSSLSAEKLAEINRKIDELLKELKRSGTGDDALKALARAKNELSDLKKGLNDLLKLADSLSKNPDTRSLADALKSGSRNDMKKNIRELKDKISRLDEAQRKKLAEDLKKASETVSDNKELAESLSGLGRAVASNDSSSTGKSISGLESSLSSLTQDTGQSGTSSSQDLDRLIASLSDAKRKVAESTDDGSQPSMADSRDGDSQDGDGQGNSDQGDNGQGDSQGDGQGQSQGEGQSNSGGGGAGTGTTNTDAGYSGEDSGYAGRNSGDKTVKDFESIYIPDRLSGDAQQSRVKGQKGTKGQSRWTDADNAPVEKGSIIPYNQVLGEYRNEAITSIQGSAVPPVMKDIVRDYFSSLE